MTTAKLRRTVTGRHALALLATSVCLAGGVGPAGAQQDGVPTQPPHAPPAATEPAPSAAPAAKPPRPRDALSLALEENESLRAANAALRQSLAKAELDLQEALRQLEELRQFVADHERFGNDFAQYQSFMELQQREARRREAEAARERREAERQERDSRRDALRLERERREAQNLRAARYRRLGFTSIGSEVYTSRMAYFYETKDQTRTRISYDPFLGRYLRTTTTAEVDYSQMTISGSILNGSNEVRNIGVAITFFDDNGNQVGHEIVQVNNARPDVPYPFTSKVAMALNRPFASSTAYVLFADVVENGDMTAPPAQGQISDAAAGNGATPSVPYAPKP